MTDIRVVTHSGEDVILQVVEFDADKLAEDMNNNDIIGISLGGAAFSRIDIKLAIPVTLE